MTQYKEFSSKDLYKSFLAPNKKAQKGRTATVCVEGVEFTVNIKSPSSISKKIGMLKLLDMYTALDHLIPEGEYILRMDPKQHGGSYDSKRPIIDPDVYLPGLTDDEIERRTAFIKDVYRLLDNDSVITSIVEFAEKKKNKTLSKSVKTRIACSGMVNIDAQVFSIIGKAIDDTTLSIEAQWTSFSEKELYNIEHDFISYYPDILK